MTPEHLTAIELEPVAPMAREAVVRALADNGRGSFLVLNTCQRLECFGFGDADGVEHASVLRTWSGAAAFERLVRIAAGLESRILGELEVLGQVRDAYRRFREQGGATDNVLDRVFQDALALARKARRESGIDRTLTSLSSLASQALMERVAEGAPVAVIGSGTLGSSVVRCLSDRGRHPIRIAGRCPANALRLAAEVSGFGAGLDDLAPMLNGAGGIVTATAAPHPVLYPHHVEHALRPLVIVDLGTPPDCSAEVAALDGVTYIGLAAIEDRAQINLGERQRKAEVAEQVIREGVCKWAALS